jgi:hypothetical protein
MQHRDKAIEKIYNFFVNSRDFNGIPLSTLAENLGIEYNDVLPILRVLVEENVASIQGDLNPHIIRFGHYQKDTQLQYLKKAELNERKIIDTLLRNSIDPELPSIQIVVESVPLCVYPSPSYLKTNRDVSGMENVPFTKQLALGEAFLMPMFFELNVLERYFTDPRYHFTFHDYSGQISYQETEEQKSTLKDHDQIFLKSFGLGYDEEQTRVVVAYLHDLNDLTPEHQVYWKNKEYESKCQMVSEYYQNTIRGEWSFGHSLFSAFIEEQRIINEMSELITGKKLFKKTFDEGQQPKEFTFFISPTLDNYERFISLLDKMLSENLDKDFFRGAIELNAFEKISEEIFVRREKGTLALLEEWLRKNYKLMHEEGYKELFEPFKRVRSERQSPAHKISENYYDKTFFKQQMDLMKEVYFSLKSLRCILQQHPKVRNFEIPHWIMDGDIKEF